MCRQCRQTLMGGDSEGKEVTMDLDPDGVPLLDDSWIKWPGKIYSRLNILWVT